MNKKYFYRYRGSIKTEKEIKRQEAGKEARKGKKSREKKYEKWW